MTNNIEIIAASYLNKDGSPKKVWLRKYELGLKQAIMQYEIASKIVSSIR